MKINRRRFIGFTAGAAAGTTMGVPVSKTLSDVIAATEAPYYPPRGPEDFALSVCKLCPAGCGLRVRRIGGRPVKADGNPFHPINKGRLCPKGQAAIQSLFHPDRISQPMKLVGARGSIESYEPSTWREALTAIAERLTLLRTVGRPESLALLRGSDRGLGARIASRFLKAFGSPNDIVLDRGDRAGAMTVETMQGVRSAPVYDIEATDYVLSFDAALLEASTSPVHMMGAYGSFRQGRSGRRGKLVHVGPRLSITGSAADEWIEVHPGTEGILALGIAQVLTAEGLYDREFIRRRCSGFFSAGSRTDLVLETLLESDYGLGRVAEVTGVRNDVILRIAREFAAARSKLAIGPRRGPLLPGGFFDHLAVHALNAMVGNLDQEGGVLLPDELSVAPWPDLPEDPVAASGLTKQRLDFAGSRFDILQDDPEGLAEALLGGAGRYPLEVLMVLGADPLLTSASPDRFAKALERIPLVVAFSTVPDDTAVAADWILPTTHFLESWDVDVNPPGVPFAAVSLAQPVAESEFGEARPPAEVFFALASEIGGTIADAFPWANLEHLAQEECKGLFEVKRGAKMGTDFDEAWVRMMERAGWWAPGYRTVDELVRKMRETGGWWDPFYDHGDWTRVLQTESGRFEFRADLLAELAAERTRQPRSGAELEGGRDPLLPLVLFEPLPISAGIGAELPFLQNLLDPALEESWECWAEIHPETAHLLDIHDKDRLRVSSDAGSIEVRARVTPRVVEGAVAIPVGLGKRAGGRWARNVGANPLRLLSTVREPVAGLPDMGATRVRLAVVRRASRREGTRS